MYQKFIIIKLEVYDMLLLLLYRHQKPLTFTMSRKVL